MSLSSDDRADLVEVGRVAKPHGVRGAVIFQLVSNRPERVAVGARLQSEDRVLTVAAAAPYQGVEGRYLVEFVQLCSREDAESVAGQLVYGEPIEDADVIWTRDLFGAQVVDQSGKELGQVVGVEANPASDLLVLDGGARIPARFVVSHTGDVVTVDIPDGLIEATT